MRREPRRHAGDPVEHDEHRAGQGDGAAQGLPAPEGFAEQHRRQRHDRQRLHDDEQGGVGRRRAHETPVRERERHAEAEHAHRGDPRVVRAGDARESDAAPRERPQQRRADHTPGERERRGRNAVEGEPGDDVRRRVDEIRAEEGEVSPHRGRGRAASPRSRSRARRRRACRGGDRRRPRGIPRARGA